MTVLNEKGQAHISLVHELFLIDLDPGGCETTSILEALELDRVGSERWGYDRGQDRGVSFCSKRAKHTNSVTSWLQFI